MLSLPLLAAWAKGARFDKGGASFRFVGAPKAAMTAVGAFLEHIRATLSQGPKKQYYRDEPAMLHQDARAQALAEWKVLDDEGRRPFQQKAAGKPCCCCFLRLTALTIANPQALCRLLSPGQGRPGLNNSTGQLCLDSTTEQSGEPRWGQCLTLASGRFWLVKLHV